MDRALEQLPEARHFPAGRMAFVVGPRQVGKTVLARKLAERRGSVDLCRNWDDLEWRREFARAPYGFVDAYRPRRRAGKPLVVIDEIHKYPRWKRYLKGISCSLAKAGRGRSSRRSRARPVPVRPSGTLPTGWASSTGCSSSPTCGSPARRAICTCSTRPRS
ncbi:MAG: AAA family ATPase [Deltaproteobacteria bacterium]|nr:AAA family ATPase [Deltaproteobacteria bacterium]